MAGQADGSDLAAKASQSPRTPSAPSTVVLELLPEYETDSHVETASADLPPEAAEDVSIRILVTSAETQPDFDCALISEPLPKMEIQMDGELVSTELQTIDVTFVGNKGQASMNLLPEVVSGRFFYILKRQMFLMPSIYSTPTAGNFCTL